MRMLDAAKEIKVGVHPTIHLLGLTVDADIVASTLLAMAIFLALGFAMRARVTDGVPGKLQVIWEFIVEQVSDLAHSVMGARGKKFVPIGVTVFLFILICNWLELLPTALRPGTSAEILPAPTGDVNLPLAMALLVIVWVHIESLRARGARGYVKHYFQPYVALAPINVIEEITKPITMTFRLFGNLFSGGLMILVMTTLLPIYVVPVGEIVWKPFDLFIGAIQAFIFMLLTVLYFGMATSHEEEHEAVLEHS
ncbi:MAG: F0F1 ATP synthase subunit A [Acidobacteriota bacterium]|nr:F0F1 ATP synthase subunit A [Acidobacteriota bacterium]